MSRTHTTWVGLDAHKNSIKVAALLPGQAEAVEWSEDTTAEAIRRLAPRLQRAGLGRDSLLLRGRADRLRPAAPAARGRGGLHGHRALR